MLRRLEFGFTIFRCRIDYLWVYLSEPKEASGKGAPVRAARWHACDWLNKVAGFEKELFYLIPCNGLKHLWHYVDFRVVEIDKALFQVKDVEMHRCVLSLKQTDDFWEGDVPGNYEYVNEVTFCATAG